MYGIINKAVLLNFYCFQSDRIQSPPSVGTLRSKELALTQMHSISSQKSKSKKESKRTEYGLKETFNPLFDLSVDLYR